MELCAAMPLPSSAGTLPRGTASRNDPQPEALLYFAHPLLQLLG